MIVASGRAMRMTSDAFCTRVWKRASPRQRVESLGHRLTTDGHCSLRGKDLDRASKLEGELVEARNDYQALQLTVGRKRAHELFWRAVPRGAVAAPR